MHGDSSTTIRLTPSIQSITLNLPPSCIEFCPAFPEYLLLGTYNLQESEPQPQQEPLESSRDGDGQHSRVQTRNGSLVVYRLQDRALTQIQALSQPSAILDLHFQPTEHRKDHCAAVASTGSLSTFRLLPVESPTSPLQPSASIRLPGVGEDVLFLSCSWHPTVPDLLAVTTSAGEVRLINIPDAAKVQGSPSLAPVITHSLEAWTVAMSPEIAPPDAPTLEAQHSTFTVYSGGDDSQLKYVSCTLSERLENGLSHMTYSASLAVRNIPGHQAGVTAILPLALVLPDSSRLVLTGSYDDCIRAYAVNQTSGARLLAEEKIGGGVWRLRLLNMLTEAVGGEPADSQLPWTCRILASCMHVGVRVLQFHVSGDEVCHITTIARFEEHKSMTYASDFQPCRTSRTQLCVSTSFYDKLLCLWEIAG